jgi:hypothetical protein
MSLALKMRLGYQASQSMVAPAGTFRVSSNLGTVDFNI